MKQLLYNAVIINEEQQSTGYILIDGDSIAYIGKGTPDNSLMTAGDTKLIDCDGDMLMPGAIDTHVHFRDPGLTAKGDIATESQAAVAGGVTSYFDMPNTNPATVTLEAWNNKMKHAAEASVANYAFFLGATNDNLDTLLSADYSRVPGIKLFMGSSTGNMLVDNTKMLEDLFKKSPAVIVVHAEDEDTIRANRTALETKYPDGNVPIHLHSTLRSREACVKSSRQAVEFARKYDTRLHIAHISTADELNLLSSGPVDKKKITAETCPHYLLYNDTDIETLGARVKCNPAIKTEKDRQSLVYALKNQLIDTIATDHAPHLPSDKEGDLFHAASGMPGIQFSLPLILSMGFEPTLTARLMAHNPALIFSIDRRGFLKQGYKADVVRIKKLKRPHTVTDKDVLSKCGWTPYRNFSMTYAVISTWVNGHETFCDGKVLDSKAACELHFNQKSSNYSLNVADNK